MAQSGTILRRHGSRVPRLEFARQVPNVAAWGCEWLWGSEIAVKPRLLAQIPGGGMPLKPCRSGTVLQVGVVAQNLSFSGSQIFQMDADFRRPDSPQAPLSELPEVWLYE